MQEAPLSEAQAVYRCFSAGGQLLYVGTTGRLGRRLAEHAQKIWWPEVYGITLEWYASEEGAVAAERRSIKIEHPKYNIIHGNSGPDLRPRAALRTALRPVAVLPPSGRPARAGRAGFRECLASAPPGGVTPLELREASGLSRALIQSILREMVEKGEVVRLEYGRYRPASPDITARAGAGPDGRLETPEMIMNGRRL